MFTQTDLEQIKEHSLSLESVNTQISNFKSGFAPIAISRAATKGDGILSYNDSETEEMNKVYDSVKESLSFIKFVPASGAATRMFKDVYDFVDNANENKESQKVVAGLKNFAFYPLLKENGIDTTNNTAALAAIVGEPLRYGMMPKGLIPFHTYDDHIRTAVEEQLVEGALYSSSKGEATIHFTVSPEHRALFEALVVAKAPFYEKMFDIKYNISYSEQKSSTDTIAVDMNNEPFRSKDGKLLFRPAGHGALIENLNDLEADVIFIKTIDNLCHQRVIEKSVESKKLLVALLYSTREAIFGYIEKLASNNCEQLTAEVANFIESKLAYKLSPSYSALSLEEKGKYLLSILSRPLRVCGVVKNEGEPGGGPFWVKASDGSESLQIVESAQIGEKDKHLISEATHFNPVDVVCGVKDYKGAKYDLKDFVDSATGFITVKSKDGAELKAQELPGLWNGAMANWNTLFVEVDIATFNPVKVLSDLLRPQHQQQ